MKKRFLKAALCLLFLVILITVSTSCSESKGLEFTSVVVATEGMSGAEKYIAYTRALKELAVIKESE